MYFPPRNWGAARRQALAEAKEGLPADHASTSVADTVLYTGGDYHRIIRPRTWESFVTHRSVAGRDSSRVGVLSRLRETRTSHYSERV